MASRSLPADLLGAHVSVAGGVDTAPARAAALPARAFQLFTKNQNRWTAPPLEATTVAAWQAALAGHGLSCRLACCHDSYLINLATTDALVRRRSIAAFVDEIERCARLGIPFLVFHPGSHLGAGEMAGLRRVARELDACVDKAGAGKVPGTESVLLCLETTAGQGTNLGWRAEHLRDIIAASRHAERLAVCLDTCHVFAAGYDLRTPAAWAKTAAAFDTAVGLDRVRVLHLNDATRDLGSRVDRHARIGAGTLGAAAFRHVLRDPRLAGALGILEVPGGDAAYAEDLAKLRRLRGRIPAPAAF